MDNPIIHGIKSSIVTIAGVYNYKFNSVFKLSEKAKGFVFLASTNKAKLLVLGEISTVIVGKNAIEIKEETCVSIFKEQFGSIISIDGKILFNDNENKKNETKIATIKLDNQSVKIFDRMKLRSPLETGIFAIDTRIPIGKGQRQLIIGNRKTGKTTIALSAIIRQKNTNMKTIYVSIGQKQSSVIEVYNDLKDNDALKNTIILYPNLESNGELLYSPYIGMAMAEGLANQGEDVLVIFDDLSKHANVYREISLLIGKSVGREAFPGDMFFMHSKVLEKAGKFNEKYNYGTISCLPIVETINEDISSLIPSNIISITDGQIFTDQKMFNQGIRPAINVGLSVSRTGGAVQNKIIKIESSQLLSLYSKYTSYKKLDEMSFDISKDIQNIIGQGKIIDKLFNRPGFNYFTPIYIIVVSQLVKWSWINNIKDVSGFMELIMNHINSDPSLKTLTNRIQLEGFTKRNKELFKMLLAPMVDAYYEQNKIKNNSLSGIKMAKFLKKEIAFFVKGIK